MTLLDSSRSELARLKKVEGGLRGEIHKYESVAAKARAEAGKKREAAAKTNSSSSARSYLRTAENEDKKMVAAEGKVAQLRKKVGENAAAQTRKLKSIEAAEKSDRRASDRADDQRRRKEIGHAREVARLSKPTIRYVQVTAPKPEPLRVLYLTANPEAIEYETEQPDGTIVRENVWLRTEAEIRSVKQALKASKFRDDVELEHLSAATHTDLLDGINDVRPHVIHFSGHGGSEALLFDNGSVEAPEGQTVTFELLAETLAATDAPPVLLVLNACDTLEGAETILPAVPVVIAMADTIADVAAAVFATRFYSAIASGQSVGSALKQGKAAMRAASLDDADLPAEVTRNDVDINDLVLVRPGEN